MYRFPEYSIDLADSQYASQFYDRIKDEYVFTVEYGTRFYLKLDTNAFPPPTSSNVELYRDGHHLQRMRNGTINLEGTSMDIQSANKGHEGTYTIEATNGATMKFRLEVEGIP